MATEMVCEPSVGMGVSMGTGAGAQPSFLKSVARLLVRKKQGRHVTSGAAEAREPQSWAALSAKTYTAGVRRSPSINRMEHTPTPSQAEETRALLSGSRSVGEAEAARAAKGTMADRFASPQPAYEHLEAAAATAPQHVGGWRRSMPAGLEHGGALPALHGSRGESLARHGSSLPTTMGSGGGWITESSQEGGGVHGQQFEPKVRTEGRV